jgi:hypothetical protein
MPETNVLTSACTLQKPKERATGKLETQGTKTLLRVAATISAENSFYFSTW